MTPRAVLAGLLAFAWAAQARGEPETHVAPTADPTFAELPPATPLWAGGPPGSGGRTPPERTRWEHYGTLWYPVVYHISNPSIVAFLPPPDRATGTAVVVCPGGGHQYLALEHEGNAVGKWLCARGVAAFVLKYRLAREPDSPYRVDVESLMDAQRALRTVRSRAKAWNVNPAAVGIMGFSAGGELALLAATRFAEPVGVPADAVDALDCRPDFQAIFYPGLPREPLALSARTPPAFLCAAYDDGFQLTTPMVRLYLDLAAAGVPTEMHVYRSGGHGFGIRDEDKAVYSWMPLFLTWLGEVGFAPARAPGAPVAR